jgi:hypothetical protein
MMSALTEFLAWCDPRPPYVQGEADGLAGRPGPPFPKGNATWAEKLYNRGWEAGITKRRITAADNSSRGHSLTRAPGSHPGDQGDGTLSPLHQTAPPIGSGA